MSFFEIFYSLFILAFIFIAIIIFRHEKISGISATPTLRRTRTVMINMLKRHELHPVRIYDLGSGWGGLLQRLHKEFPNAAVRGYETSFFPYWVSKIFTCFSKNIQIEQKNFFEIEFTHNDVVMCYLSPQHMAKLKSKWESGAGHPGSVISASFPIKGWEPIMVEKRGKLIPSFIYLYKL